MWSIRGKASIDGSCVFALEFHQMGCWGQLVCGGEGCSVADRKGTWIGSLPKLADKIGVLVEGRGRW